jgi:hypothetical protein
MQVSGEGFLLITLHPHDCIFEVPHVQLFLLLLWMLLHISFSIKRYDSVEMLKVRYFTADDGHRFA